MPNHLLQALNDVRCAQPFAILGWQTAEKGLLIRAFLPSALRVTAVALDDGKALGEMHAVADVPGLFELQLPRRKNQLPYRLEVQSAQHSYSVIDPYQF